MRVYSAYTRRPHSPQRNPYTRMCPSPGSLSDDTIAASYSASVNPSSAAVRRDLVSESYRARFSLFVIIPFPIALPMPVLDSPYSPCIPTVGSVSPRHRSHSKSINSRIYAISAMTRLAIRWSQVARPDTSMACTTAPNVPCSLRSLIFIARSIWIALLTRQELAPIPRHVVGNVTGVGSAYRQELPTAVVDQVI